MTATKKMRYSAGQIAKLCKISRVTVRDHRVKGIIRNGKKNSLGYWEWPRSQVSLYMWQTHGLKLEEVE